MTIESLFILSASSDDADDEEGPPVLVCCLSSGTLLHICGIPFAAISDGETLNPSVLQSLKVHKFSTAFPCSLKCLYLPRTSSSTCRVLVIDSAGGLHVLELDTDGGADSSVPNFRALALIGSDVSSSVAYLDAAVLPGSLSSMALLLSSDGTFQLLHLNTLEVVRAFSCLSFVDLTMDQIVTVQLLFSSSEQGDALSSAVLFSVAHEEDADTPSVLSTFLLTFHDCQTGMAPVTNLLLLDQSSLTHRCGTSSLLCGSMFPIVESLEQHQGSARFVRWCSATEICVVSCHDAALLEAVSRFEESRQSMQRQLKQSNTADSALHTDCISLLGYLEAVGMESASGAAQPSLFFLLDHLQDALMVQTSPSEVMALVRGSLFASCPLEACSALLQSAKVRVH